MKNSVSKRNDDLAFFNSRLDEVRMTSYERLVAKAHLARAEAVAEMLSAAVRAIGGLFRPVRAKPGQRPAHVAG